MTKVKKCPPPQKCKKCYSTDFKIEEKGDKFKCTCIACGHKNPDVPVVFVEMEIVPQKKGPRVDIEYQGHNKRIEKLQRGLMMGERAFERKMGIKR
jgi:hypothetical protein